MINAGLCPAPIYNFKNSNRESGINHGDNFNQKKYRYKGAIVLDPIPGFYKNVVVIDAASLYPTMVITYNLSFDTINCKCCKGVKNAKPEIDAKFFQGCKYISKDTCWICKKRIGAFPLKLIKFKKERLVQKELGNEAKQLALKIMSNGGYGCFGNENFRYYDPRVAEFVTTYGRYTLSKMQEIAKRLGFSILYGDTDSLMLNNPPSEKALTKFQELCKSELDVDMEIKKRYRRFILSAGKKHYLGIGVDDKNRAVFDIVGFEGKKSDRCEFTHKVFRNVINSILKENTNPIPELTKAFTDLTAGKINSKLLIKSIKLGQNPEDYKELGDLPSQVGRTLKARKGDLVEYFTANKKKFGKSWCLDLKHADLHDYAEKTWNTVKEVLKLSGYPTEELERKLIVDKYADANSRAVSKRKVRRDNGKK
jgi:DNA polymerase, archaea type